MYPPIAIGLGAYDAWNLWRKYTDPERDPPPGRFYPPYGYWVKTAGDYRYSKPYNGYNVANSEHFRSAQRTWHEPITGQSISGTHSYGYPIPGGWDTLGYWWRTQGTSVIRYAHHSSWRRVTHPINADNVWWSPPGPDFTPWGDPFVPPGRSAPQPKGNPYRGPRISRKPDPNRSPSEQTERGNKPRNRRNPDIPVLPTIGTPSNPQGYGIAQVPGRNTPPGLVEVEVAVSGSTSIGPAIETYPQPQPYSPAAAAPPRRPPGRREYERKQKVSYFGRYSPIIGGITESADYIDAVWKGLPEKYRYRFGYQPTPQKKAWLAWKYRHKIDAGDVFSALAENEIEDAVIGRLGKGAQTINRHLPYRRPGLLAGPAI